MERSLDDLKKGNAISRAATRLDGPLFRSWRERQQLSIRRAASLLDVSPSTIQNWENDATRIPRSVALLVSRDRYKCVEFPTTLAEKAAWLSQYYRGSITAYERAWTGACHAMGDIVGPTGYAVYPKDATIYPQPDGSWVTHRNDVGFGGIIPTPFGLLEWQGSAGWVPHDRDAWLAAEP